MEKVQRIGRWLGIVLFVVMLIWRGPSDMPKEAWRGAAVAVLMAVWWMTEAVPLPVTSLLPLVLFPFLGVVSMKEAAAPYAHHLIFLFMGGFMIARAMEKWNLHRRIALATVAGFGLRPRRMVLGFMVATALLSMWISNTATAMMMVPIGMAVLSRTGDMDHDGNFGVAMMLGIAYSASIGGMATIIGTPPNTVMVAMVDQLFGRTITFAQWMTVGVPLSFVMLLVTWWMLTRVQFPLGTASGAGADVLRRERAELGSVTSAEIRVVVIGSLVALCWIVRGFVHWEVLAHVQDSTIAMAGAVLLFLVPAGGEERHRSLMDWETARTIPWGVMLLFGGGLSLAAAFMKTGLAGWIAARLSALHMAGPEVLIIAVVFLTLSLTELTSNTAMATLLIPIVAGLAITVGCHPYVLMAGTAIAASYAFMLPVATPPNAVVFGSGRVTIRQMVRAGLLLNIIGALINVLVVLYLLPFAWDLDRFAVPEWARGIAGF